MSERYKVLTRMDCKKAERDILRFISSTVFKAKAEGVVLGLSGGVDSSVVAALCAKALGEGRVLGLFMPAKFTPSEDQADAKAIAEGLGIRTYLIPLDPIIDRFLETLPLKASSRVVVGNVFARMRMVVSYFFANSLNYLVAGTGDRSEHLIGYFTKYGDGGADFLPIGHLFKTQVRTLARHLNLPSRIVDKPASPQLWSGHRATEEIPVDYPVLDLILHGLFDARVSANAISKQFDVRSEIVESTKRLFECSHHKRTVPLTPATKVFRSDLPRHRRICSRSA